MQNSPSRRAVLIGAGSLALLLAGCTRTTDITPTADGKRSITLQTPAVAATWDPVAATDTESQRVVRQVYDTLIGLDGQTGNPSPALAESWEISEDGLTYSFRLREGVTFHDGTDLDAAAVVTNIQRWIALGRSDSPDVGDVSTLFDSRADAGEKTPSKRSSENSSSDKKSTQDPAPTPQLTQQDPLGQSDASVVAPVAQVTAVTARTVRLKLRRRLTPLLRALAQPVFGIVSPAALAQAGAMTSVPKEGGLRRKAVGTGAFTAAEDGDTVVLTATKDHFTGEPGVDEVRLVPTPSVTRRAWDLSAERSDAFDLVTVDVLKSLVQSGLQVPPRDPFSVAYLGLNRSQRWLGEDRVRRAIAHALDRNALLELFLSSTKAAKSPLAPSLGVKEPSIEYGHDQAKAKRLLEEADYDGSAIPFVFPTGVERPYLPQPELLYALISGQLGTVGLNIEPVPLAWDEGYLDAVTNGRHPGLHLLGLQGTYRDPECFLGRLFLRTSAEFDYDAPEVRRRLRQARALPDGDARLAAYADVAELLTLDLPLIPLVYPISSLALGPRISEYPLSPVLDEPFSQIKLTQ